MIAYSKLSAPVVQCVPVETVSPTALEIIEKPVSSAGTVILANSLPKVGNLVIRSSLKASTGDGVFAIMFSNITGGVLLSNFLLQLGASSIEIGMLASVPMLANLLQPLGAYISELTTSRRWYNVCIYAASRLLWLILVLGIGWSCWHHSESHALVTWTLVIVLASNVIAA
ncbi:MAG: hypothetical protein KME08_20950, partial [Aphanothece sp. CMT-3BRIN-NPC111]|nr:hypothetical protein [Aphanothece sp. CMT-3BRIN-NPC111]